MLDTTPSDQQRAHMPALAVPCPRCGAKAARLCTSHSGTRPRLTSVHQDRRTAWADAPTTTPRDTPR